jgi:hypothetical protein
MSEAASDSPKSVLSRAAGLPILTGHPTQSRNLLCYFGITTISSFGSASSVA